MQVDEALDSGPMSPTNEIQRNLQHLSLTECASPVIFNRSGGKKVLYVGAALPGTGKENAIKRRPSNSGAPRNSAMRRSLSSRQKRKSVSFQRGETDGNLVEQLRHMNRGGFESASVDSLGSANHRVLAAPHKSPKRAVDSAPDSAQALRSAGRRRLTGQLAKTRAVSGQSLIALCEPARRHQSTPERPAARSLFACTPTSADKPDTPFGSAPEQRDMFSPYKPPKSGAPRPLARSSGSATFRRTTSEMGAPRDFTFAVPSLPTRADDGEPRAKRRPQSCIVRGDSAAAGGGFNPLTQSAAEFVRNEPLDALHQLRLPNKQERAMNVITPTTLAALLNGRYTEHFDRVVVVDARFLYEYEGGHIRDAVHVPTELELYSLLQRKPPRENGERICVVFHCEFSSQRGPALYRALREWDRAQHEDCYPQLYYPELYLLKGGYKRFFAECGSLCEPQAYQPMFDRKFKEEMRTGLGTIQRSSRGRRSMSMNDIGDYRDLRRSLEL